MSEVCRESVHYQCWKKAKAEHEQRREDAPAVAADESAAVAVVAAAAAAVETTNQTDYRPEASSVPCGSDEPASVTAAAGSDEPAVIDRMSVVEVGELLAATASVAIAAAGRNAGARTVQSELGYGKKCACS